MQALRRGLVRGWRQNSCRDFGVPIAAACSDVAGEPYPVVVVRTVGRNTKTSVKNANAGVCSDPQRNRPAVDQAQPGEGARTFRQEADLRVERANEIGAGQLVLVDNRCAAALE